MKTLVCPHCHTQVPESASVCTGCGAEIVHGLNRRERSFVGLSFVALALLIGVLIWRGLEIAHGAPVLPSPKAEDGFFVSAGLIVLIVFPYCIGKSFGRFLCRSRVRFFRSYQHQ
jgi:predicted nucleic acid-binding Zn ribbon protein